MIDDSEEEQRGQAPEKRKATKDLQSAKYLRRRRRCDQSLRPSRNQRFNVSNSVFRTKREGEACFTEEGGGHRGLRASVSGDRVR